MKIILDSHLKICPSKVNVTCYKTLQFDSYTFSVLVHTVIGCQ